jgi:hypothetical protein
VEQSADEGGALVGLSGWGWGWGWGARHAFARGQLFASAIGVMIAAAGPGAANRMLQMLVGSTRSSGPDRHRFVR